MKIKNAIIIKTKGAHIFNSVLWGWQDCEMWYYYAYDFLRKQEVFYALFPQSVKESLLNQSCEAEKGD